MPTPKIDPKIIFASDAPAQDKPAVFNNYTKGMDETRSNEGRPTIKQANALQQSTDQKILWIHENGGALPYDSTIDYADGSIVLKDGVFKQYNGTEWIDFFGATQPINKGGTGATTVETARANLGVWSSIETQTAIDNKTVTIPDATEATAGKAKIATTAIAQAGMNDTDFITAKKLRDAFNASGNAPVSACRAWLNMSGQGGVTIRASANIASVVREQAGVYLVKTSVAMPIVNFAVLVGGSYSSAVSSAGANGNINIINVSADSFRVFYSDGSLNDLYNLTLGVFC